MSENQLLANAMFMTASKKVKLWKKKIFYLLTTFL
jgi:hypothetical protein